MTKAQRNREMKTYKDLVLWQKAINVVTETYRVTSRFPKEEIYGLTSQIRRSAVWVPSNEGYGRKSTNDYLRFLQISMGSLFELQTQLQIARNLKFITDEIFQEIYDSTREVERMLSSLINKINSK